MCLLLNGHVCVGQKHKCDSCLMIKISWVSLSFSFSAALAKALTRETLSSIRLCVQCPLVQRSGSHCGVLRGGTSFPQRDDSFITIGCSLATCSELALLKTLGVKTELNTHNFSWAM